MVKQAHHRGTYHAKAKLIRLRANADPSTKCWRCGLTLAEIRKDHPTAKWTAGHLVAGLAEGPLAAECSPCNFSHGGRLGNRRARVRGTRTRLTW